MSGESGNGANHLSSVELETFVLAEADKHTASRVEDHLRVCLDCRRAVEEGRSHEDVLKQLREASEGGQIGGGGGGSIEGLALRDRIPLGPSRCEPYVGRFDHYDVVGMLGLGPIGVVLACDDASSNRRVAVKVLHVRWCAHEAMVAAFQTASETAATLDHPNIRPILDTGKVRHAPYVDMEHVEGRSLAEVLSQRRPMPSEDAVAVASQVASALACAHQQGLAHHDLKPTNILLAEGVPAQAVVTDFGLAPALAAAPDVPWRAAFWGTPAYMSPEQAAGRHVDARSDLFSLGCVLFEMCCGRRPFEADTALDTMYLLANTPAPAIDHINPEVPDWLCRVVLRALEKDPEQRYQSADEFKADLGQC